MQRVHANTQQRAVPTICRTIRYILSTKRIRRAFVSTRARLANLADSRVSGVKNHNLIICLFSLSLLYYSERVWLAVR